MLNTLKLGRPLQPPSISLNSSKSNINHFTRRAAPPSTLRSLHSDSGEMDQHKKQSEPESKTVDSMSSFGEGYATRSDEEGFGGIYGGNQSVSKDADDKDEDAKNNINHEFDHSQGSEVKEKEKARHQKNVAN